MGRLRKSRTAGKGTNINTTRYGRKFKKKYDKSKYTVKMSNIRERWNSKMSLKTNMKRLGLVYDINADIRPYKKAEKMEFMTIESATAAATNNDNELEPMDTVHNDDNSTTVTKKGKKKKTSKKAKLLRNEFETRASIPERPRCHLSTAETEYLIPLMNKHGSDYKKMSRDKQNYDQKTEAQLRKKCEQLLESKEARHLKKCEELELI